jgi:hypothetical protein
MPSEENKTLQACFAPIFKRHGFKKRGATWHLCGKEFISVFNIQGSQFSLFFYLNLGIYIRELGPKETPTEYQCHVRVRGDQIVSNRQRLVDNLDFEAPIPQGKRLRELADLVETEMIPWLVSISSKEKLKELVLADTCQGLPIAKQVWGYLEIKKDFSENR